MSYFKTPQNEVYAYEDEQMEWVAEHNKIAELGLTEISEAEAMAITNPPRPLTEEQIRAAIDRVITQRLNGVAQVYGYRDIYTPVNALTSPLPQVAQEAQMLLDYYNAVWAYAIEHQNEAAKYVIAENGIPVRVDEAAVIADLPAFGGAA